MAMEIGRTPLLWPLLLAGLLCACVKEAGAINFNIVNQCSYTVWAAGSPVGGGKELANGESWSVDVPAGTSGGRFWGRTSCTFDASGKGSCQTGDCGGVLACTGYGSVPATLAEYALNQYMNLDFYDISLVDGFNIPLSFAPTKGCTTIACKSDINAVCPSELKVTDGCDSACHKLKDDQYCCTGAYQDRSKCIPTNYSEFFKTQCPQAYSYAYDDATSTFTCPGGTTDYKIVFCP